MTTEEDDLYNIRTAYYTGDFKNVLKEARNLKSLAGMKAKERDAFVCRALLAQKNYKKVSDITSDSLSTPLLAVKQLSIYKQATSTEERELVIETLKGYLEEDSVRENDTFCVVATQIFIEEQTYKEALKLVQQAGHSLEKLLMQVQIYLRINRPDLAAKSLSKMEETDDDDPLTTLAHASINIFVGGEEKNTEALELLDDLCSNSETALIRNLMVVAHMQLLQFTQAWKVLQKARDCAKESAIEMPPSTLINGIICLQHLNRGTHNLDKLNSELKRVAPDHRYLRRNEEMETLFDRSAQNFKL